MKTIISAILALALMLPGVSHALSCMSPEMQMENFGENADFIIFTATAGETIEHVKEPADTTGQDPNRVFNEGYTGQYVEVSELHKGQVSGGLWVYYNQNSTWGYMCAGAPAAAGTEMLYVITAPNGNFGMPFVNSAYAADSAVAQNIITQLAAAEDNGPAYVNFTTSENWRTDLANEILEMVFLIRIKLAEWRWWKAQE